MRVGESAQLQAVPADGSGRPYTGLFTLSWSSSAVLVATVSDTGQLTALADGMTVITAQATRLDTGAMASASVTLTVGSPMMVDTTPPSSPGGLMAAAASPTEVNLSWVASTDDVGVSGYLSASGGDPDRCGRDDELLGRGAERCHQLSLRWWPSTPRATAARHRPR